MTEIQALQLAIETMGTEAYLMEPLASDWRKYGNTLAFRRDEARRVAQKQDQLNEAVEVLKVLKARLLAGAG